MIKPFIITFIALSLLLTGCSSQSSQESAQAVSLANCLADNNVKEYGAFWCPNCAKQSKIFGKDAEAVLKSRGVYVECDPRGDNEQSILCIEKKIEKYPTWEFPNGQTLIGVFSLAELAQQAGCPF